jgi:hypothetical protein
VRLDNSPRLAVELVTNRETANSVRKQITVESFDFPDLIADIDRLRRIAHLIDPPMVDVTDTPDRRRAARIFSLTATSGFCKPPPQ